MKRKFLFSALAVLAAIAVSFSMSAFRTTESSANDTKAVLDHVWYSFSGTPDDYGNPSAYNRLPDEVDPPNCFGTQVVCAIKLPANGSSSQPDVNDLDPITIAAMVASGTEGDEIKIANLQ